MLKYLALMTASLSLAACVSISVDEHHPPREPALAAIESAHVIECPPDRTRANAQTEGYGPTTGVEGVDIAFTPLASDPTRAVRLRRITVQPGGVIAWHEHTTLQGMALLVSGEMTELRNTCLDPIVYHAGDVAREDAGTAHSWRNDGGEPAVILVAHVLPH
jgi:quercetin dioxygenase-like cupin family protein